MQYRLVLDISAYTWSLCKRMGEKEVEVKVGLVEREVGVALEVVVGMED